MKRQLTFILLAVFCLCFLGALPFYFSGFIPNFTDAFFESVSGFTTTGATVISDIETLPDWLLFWRAATQWLGGIGILSLFMFSPVFFTSGFKLFRIEAVGSDREELSPHLPQFAFSILLIYVSLTALQFLLFLIFGVDWFNALTLSFSVVSTGGFNTGNNGITGFNSSAVEWICVFFMFLAGINISLIWQLFRKKISNVIYNSEVKTYTVIVLFTVIVITIAVLPGSPSFGYALRQAFFNVVSFVSTTGFLSADYSTWPYSVQGVLFLLLFTGGCSFSAAGGVKIIRYVLLSEQAWNEMVRIVYPHGIFDVKLDGRSGYKKAVHSTVGFIFLYFLIVFLGALLVSSGGTDIFNSFITALVCQGNIGLGSHIPFHEYPAYVKLGLCLVMITGRLELWMVLVLFTGDFRRR
ncbi:MAG: TrkH family potassium uptake protein [Treponema sp.]|jgi:trk system potassium uptake protein TrkH|nr:TrkH family potassium uptake protein [Treponema sp.]